MKAFAAVALVACILFGNSVANGTTITTIEFTAIAFNSGTGVAGPPAGSSLSGFFSFDSLAVDMAAGPESGVYEFPSSLLSADMPVGGLFQNLGYSIFIHDSPPGGGDDTFTVQSVFLNDPSRASMGLTFVDHTGAALSSDALVAPPLGAMDGLFSLSCCQGRLRFIAVANIDSVTANRVSSVPEPATYACVVAGLVLLGSTARSRAPRDRKL